MSRTPECCFKIPPKKFQANEKLLPSIRMPLVDPLSSSTFKKVMETYHGISKIRPQ